jgi:hypothetical protein
LSLESPAQPGTICANPTGRLLMINGNDSNNLFCFELFLIFLMDVIFLVLVASGVALYLLYVGSFGFRRQVTCNWPSE